MKQTLLGREVKRPSSKFPKHKGKKNMKQLFSKLSIGVASVLLTALPASAQLGPGTHGHDLQGRVSVVIPFGDIAESQKQSAKYAPKLAFGLRHEQRRTDQPDWMLRSQAEAFEAREVNFSLTFGESRAVLLNDKILFQPEILRAGDEDNQEESGSLDTYDKTVLTVIGVSLAVIAGTIVIVAE